MPLLNRSTQIDKKFQNPVPTRVGGFSTVFKVLPLYLSNKAEKFPRQPLGPFHTDPKTYATPPANGLRVTWFGHSSTLLEIDGLRILIDPIWDKRAAPTSWFGPKRFFAPTLSLADLPKLDAVLISHDHFDHLGKQTVRDLARLPALANTQWITSLHVGALLEKFGVSQKQITELDWTQSVRIANGAATITSVPARHFSGRSLFNRFETLWASFVIKGSQHTVYFGADSGHWEGFTEIGDTYGPFDLTMLEIGAFHELWKDIHMGPDGAAQSYTDLGGPQRAGILMPIHWGLFDLALHAWRQPIERILQLATVNNWPLFTPKPGHPTDVTPHQSNWWQTQQ